MYSHGAVTENRSELFFFNHSGLNLRSSFDAEHVYYTAMLGEFLAPLSHFVRKQVAEDFLLVPFQGSQATG